jgi:hypothetical protein
MRLKGLETIRVTVRFCPRGSSEIHVRLGSQGMAALIAVVHRNKVDGDEDTGHACRKVGAFEPSLGRREGTVKMGAMIMAERREGPLAKELDAFEQQKPHLEQTYMGKFVVIKDGKLIGAWDTLDAAAQEAVARFGRGPYLIRQVGAPPPSLPASVMFREMHPA